VLGDSLAAGYGLPPADGFEARLAAALAARHQPVEIIDGAVPGDTSAGGLARLSWLLGARPRAAIVELGANDGLRGEDPAVLERNLSAILDRLAAARIPVLLAGMYAPPNMGQDYAARFRSVFLRLGARPGVVFEPFFLDGVAGVPALNQADGMHPNAEGEARVVAAILPYVEKLLAEVKE
jgi:acyl-CoA thioesterase-1